MSLILKSVSRKDPITVDVVAEYTVRHSAPDTTLELDMALTVGADSSKASMVIETNECLSPSDALDKLADWLERAAKAIRERGSATDHIPVFTRTRS